MGMESLAPPFEWEEGKTSSYRWGIDWGFLIWRHWPFYRVVGVVSEMDIWKRNRTFEGEHGWLSIEFRDTTAEHHVLGSSAHQTSKTLTPKKKQSTRTSTKKVCLFDVNYLKIVNVSDRWSKLWSIEVQTTFAKANVNFQVPYFRFRIFPVSNLEWN